MPSTSAGHLDARVGREVRDERGTRRSAGPKFITLATMRAGSPVAIELMITAAYSPLRSISNGSPASRRRFVASYSSRLCATRDRYSPIGTWKASTWPLGMNHGLYSAWCSEDSVG